MQVLDDIGKFFLDKGSDQLKVVALHGIAGVGKTQIALKYASSHKDTFSTILWLRADTDTRLIQDVDEIAKKLVPNKVTTSGAWKSIQEWLIDNDNWLLIYDNADDLGIVKPFWPMTQHGCVILTSRNPEVASSKIVTDRQEIQPLLPKDGADMVLQLMGEEDIEGEFKHAESISRLLGGLPLALCHVASYMDLNRCALDFFLELFEEQDMSLIDRHDSTNANFDYERSFATAWDLSLRDLDLDSQNLLEIVSLLDPDGIPEDIIRTGSKAFPPGTLPGLQDASLYNISIGLLHRRMILDKSRRSGQSGTLSIHRMIQWAVRRKWDNEKWTVTFKRVCTLLFYVYPKQVEGESLSVGTNLDHCRRLTPHVVMLHQHYKLRKLPGLGSIELAELLTHCGWYLWERDQIKTAEHILVTAVNICKSIIGDRPSLLTALAMNNLGVIYSYQGNHEAVSLRAKVVEYRRALLDPNNIQVGNALINFAVSLMDMDKNIEADKYLQDVLKSFESSRRKPETLGSLLSLAGRNYTRIGDWKNADKVLRQALENQQEYLGESHFLYTITLYHLCILRIKEGNITEAKTLAKKVLDLRLCSFDENDSRVGIARYKCAYLAYLEQDAETAVSELGRSIEAFEEQGNSIEPGLLVRSTLFLGLVLRDSSGWDIERKAGATATIERGKKLRKEKMGIPLNASWEEQEDFDNLVQPDFR